MRFHIFIGLAVLLFACSPAAGNLPAGRPFIIPSATFTPSPTATDTPSPTATFTLTPSPTATDTLTATPVPPCLRIMPLGDSITVGVPNQKDYGGYRDLLGTLLELDGYFVDFVGSQQDGIGVLPDPDHEGHSGWKITNIKEGIDLEGWIETYRPEIILLHLGTNDINRGYGAEAPANLSALLDDILFRLPETHIIVAQIIPYSSGPTDEHIALNNAIPEIAASKGPNVSVVDMQNILTPEDYSDEYHPDIQGYDKMARAWEAAILAVVPSLSLTSSCQITP